jgi:predicted transcriptional regulator
MNEEATYISEITPRVQTFIHNHFQSVWQLELILFLKKRSELLSVSEIAKSLYYTPQAIENALSDFVSSGILKASGDTPGKYGYFPENSELRDLVEQTCQAYSAKRTAVINCIFHRNTDQKSGP